LTCATLYLTLGLHTRNRAQQAALLRQQKLLLDGIVEPSPPAEEPLARELPVGLVEMAKDKWNKELELAVRKVYNTDWRRVREDLEEKAGTILDKIRENGK